jgi:hypothetical protein
MLFSTKAVLLIFIPLISALTERELEQAYHAQTRVVSLLKGRQVTTIPCATVPAPATCASSCGPGWITCPGGSAKDCYNPATEVCCGDGSTLPYIHHNSNKISLLTYSIATCPAGTTCNNVSLTCDGSGTDPGPTYTPSAASTSTYKPPTSTFKPSTSTYKPTTSYYTPPSISTPTTFVGVGGTDSTSASPFFSFASTAAAGTSAGGAGGLFTETTTAGSTATTSSSGVVLSSSGTRFGDMAGHGLFVVVAPIVAGLLLL